MLTGNKDVDLYKILMPLDDNSLLNFCQTAIKQEYEKSLCDNEDFWRNRIFNKYGKVEKNPKRTWKNFYLKTVYYDNTYPNSNFALEKLSEGGMKNLDIIIFFMGKGTHPNFGLIGATKGDHKDLIDFFIKEGANVNAGLKAASEKGDKKLVDLFIEKGSKAWNTGLLAAAKGGHNDLVNFFIDKGANDFNLSYLVAVDKGDKEIIETIKSKLV